MAEVAVDASDLRSFARAMRQASRRTGQEFRKGLRSGAEIIAVEARARAGSDKIAKTVRAGTLGASSFVQTGNKDTPEAVLLEVGNTGSEEVLLESRRSGTFRHPVFPKPGEGRDDWTWVDQPTHPYLGPAALLKQAAALEELGKGVNRALESVRLEMT